MRYRYLYAFLFATFLPSLFSIPAAPLFGQEEGVYGHYEVYESDYFDRSEYAARRKRALDRMEQGSAMFVRSAEIKNRSNDVDYEYRQRNNLLYLTGLNESEGGLLLIRDGMILPGQKEKVYEILLVAERDAQNEVWHGIQLGPDVAAEVTGIAVVYPYSELQTLLSEVFPRISRLYYDNWTIGEVTEPLVSEPVNLQTIFSDLVKKKYPGVKILGASTILNGLRKVKSPAEVAMMQKAIDISIEGHRAAMKNARPGITEFELEAEMEYQFHRLGAEEPGYPSIVGSGPNTCILHYITNRRTSRDGELVLMDCGAEYHGYSADITRTFPVNGRFSQEQRQIYQIVLDAQTEAIAACRSGNSFVKPHQIAMSVITEGLLELGILEPGDNANRYFMHGTSHFLGLDVHDVSDSYTLIPGMVITVEPGIYIPEGSDCDPKWWNIGVRIEDDILITDDQPVNLSAELERTIEEIESLMKK